MTIKFTNCIEKMSSLRNPAQRVALDEKQSGGLWRRWSWSIYERWANL